MRRLLPPQPHKGLMPADPSTFGTFMQAVAARYAGKVQAYELWNEENLDREAGTGNVDPTNYCPCSRRATAASKPAIRLRWCSSARPARRHPTSPGDHRRRQLPAAAYAINGGEVIGYFDGLSAHPSGFSNPPDCTPPRPVQPVCRLEHRRQLLRIHPD